MAGLYHDIDIDPSKGPDAMIAFTLCRPAAENYIELAEELKLARKSFFGGARVLTYVTYFIGVGFTLFFTRTSAFE